MSRLQNNLGRGLDDLIGEVSQVRAVPTRAAPAPAPAPTPSRPAAPPPAPPPASPTPRRAPSRLVPVLIVALVLAVLACCVLAWKVAHPPVVTVEVPVPAAPELLAPVPEPPPPPPRDTRLDWAQALTLPGVQVDATESRVRLVFNEAVFKSRDQLRPGVDALLKQVAAAFQPHAGPCVLVVAGHTDNDAPRPGGPYKDNVALGYLRAQAVADVLRAAGVPAASLRVTSAGDKGAPFANTDPVSKARNRTVTVLFEKAP